MGLLLQQVINGLVVGSTYALIALGFSLTFNSMRVVNMAHPDIVVVGAFAAIVLHKYVGGWLPIVGGLLIGCLLFSMVLERIVLRPLSRHSHLMTLVATAGASIAIENVLAAVFGADPVAFPGVLPLVTVTISGVTLSSGQLFALCASIIVMLIVTAYVHKTRLGRATRAVAERPDVAAAFGVPVQRVAQITIAVAALMAAVAGIAIANLYTSIGAFEGQLYAIKAFTCMLVAGSKHIEAIIVVAFGLGVAEALVTNYLSSNFTNAVTFVVLLVALSFRPAGLFGSYVRYS